MTDDTPTSTGQPKAEDSPRTAGGPSSAAGTAAGGPSVPERAATLADQKPEVAVGAAFGGGFLLALILKRLAR